MNEVVIHVNRLRSYDRSKSAKWLRNHLDRAPEMMSKIKFMLVAYMEDRGLVDILHIVNALLIKGVSDLSCFIDFKAHAMAAVLIGIIPPLLVLDILLKAWRCDTSTHFGAIRVLFTRDKTFGYGCEFVMLNPLFIESCDIRKMLAEHCIVALGNSWYNSNRAYAYQMLQRIGYAGYKEWFPLIYYGGSNGHMCASLDIIKKYWMSLEDFPDLTPLELHDANNGVFILYVHMHLFRVHIPHVMDHPNLCVVRASEQGWIHFFSLLLSRHWFADMGERRKEVAYLCKKLGCNSIGKCIELDGIATEDGNQLWGKAGPVLRRVCKIDFEPPFPVTVVTVRFAFTPDVYAFVVPFYAKSVVLSTREGYVCVPINPFTLVIRDMDFTVLSQIDLHLFMVVYRYTCVGMDRYLSDMFKMVPQEIRNVQETARKMNVMDLVCYCDIELLRAYKQTI